MTKLQEKEMTRFAEEFARGNGITDNDQIAIITRAYVSGANKQESIDIGVIREYMDRISRLKSGAVEKLNELMKRWRCRLISSDGVEYQMEEYLKKA